MRQSELASGLRHCCLPHLGKAASRFRHPCTGDLKEFMMPHTLWGTLKSGCMSFVWDHI